MCCKLSPKVLFLFVWMLIDVMLGEQKAKWFRAMNFYSFFFPSRDESA